MFIHLIMFNNKFEVFIDVILLHLLFQKVSRKDLYYSILGCMFGILLFSTSLEGNSNLVVQDSFATTTLDAAKNDSESSAGTTGKAAAAATTSTTKTLAPNTMDNTPTTITTAADPNTASSLSLSDLAMPPTQPLKNNSQVNEGTTDVSLGNPFYDSNNSILLNKLDLISADSNSNSSIDLQIFYEMGKIYNSETVHNIGYYIEESKPRSSASNESSFDIQVNESRLDKTITYAKGTGFFITSDSDRISWNAYDQVYDYSQGITKYLGLIYFTSNELPGGQLSDLANKAGIYEYDLYSNGSAHRNIWLWPSP